MTHSRSNRPTDKRPSDRSTDQRIQNQDRTNQTSDELNRNEERTSPSGRSTPTEQSERTDLSTEPWRGKERNLTTGSNVPGSEIADRPKQKYGQWNQSSGSEQWNKNSVDKNKTGMNYTGNSERSGQQYSEEGNSSQRIEERNQQYQQVQHKDQRDKTRGTQKHEFSRKERTHTAHGMDAPGMRNDQGMNQTNERKDPSKKRDKETDQIDGGE